jgi:plasmid stabilization system protein ParE
MATCGYRISRPAIADLESISDYLAERSLAAADRVIDALNDTFRSIARDREIGTSLENLRPGLRMSIGSKPADKFIVFYYLVSDGVMVSRVLHSSRDWSPLLIAEEN